MTIQEEEDDKDSDAMQWRGKGRNFVFWREKIQGKLVDDDTIVVYIDSETRLLSM